MPTPAHRPPPSSAPTPAPPAPTDDTMPLTDQNPPPEAVVAPVPRIDAAMGAYLVPAPLPENLLDAIRYSLLGPGKRLRPLLVWHCCAAAGAPPQASLPAGIAVELIHAFSLVHDDLPGMDDDDLRRGRPTLHRHTSEAMAILAGDAMLTLAFEILVQHVAEPAVSAALVRELTQGTSAMIAGQVYDTLGGFAKHTPDADRLRLIHRNKTGGLIRAACRMGVILGLHRLGRPIDGSPAGSPLGPLSDFGDAIGLMFQVVDDLLDVTQTTDHLGKRAGKDIDAGKLTYPGVHGIDKSRAEVRELSRTALAALDRLGNPGQGAAGIEPLRQLTTYLAVRTR